MPIDPDQVRRGAICLALFPFTPGFPLEMVLRESEEELLARLDRMESIEEMERTIGRGDVPEIVTKLKLRRVLVLQDLKDPRREDVAVARVNSITDQIRARRRFYAPLLQGTHPSALLLGDEDRHGTGGREAYVNLLAVTNVAWRTILRRTGHLSPEEMRDVSERLVRTLELDLSRLMARHVRGEEAPDG